jgi:hypothetical protein
MANIGVNTEERAGGNVGVLQPAPLYDAGIAIRSPKGPLGKSFLVTSLKNFAQIFYGGNVSNAYNSYYMIKGLFDNLTVSVTPNLYIVREFDSTSLGTASFFQIGTGGNTITITAAYLGDDSPGVVGNNLSFQIIAGDSPNTFKLRVFELIDGSTFFQEDSAEFTLATMSSVINTSSKFIKATVVGSPTLAITTNVAQVDDLDLTGISSGTASVDIQVEGQTSATTVSVPFNTDANTTAIDLANAINTAAIGVSAAVPSGVPNFAVTSSTAGLAVTYSALVQVAVTNTTANAKAVNLLASGADPGVVALSDAVSNLDLLLDKPIQRVFSTERTDASWAAALETYCASTKRDCLGIFQSDSTETPTGTFSNYASLRISNSFIAGYFNQGYVDDLQGSGGEKLIPLLGHIYGAYYVSNKQRQGGYAHIAPGGVEVSLRGINKLQYSDQLTPAIVTNIARLRGFNTVVNSPGFGRILESSRTMSTTNKFISIHVRESKNFLIQTFKKQLKIFQQKPNNENIRERLARTINIFLGKQFQNGMFETDGGYNNNVGVQVDDKNNDLSVRKNRQLVADLTLNFVEVSEEVNLNLIQSDGPLVVNES